MSYIGIKTKIMKSKFGTHFLIFTQKVVVPFKQNKKFLRKLIYHGMQVT